MAFLNYVYEADSGDRSYKIRLDTDQATISGAVQGVTTEGFHVQTSKGRRGFGLHARRVILTRQAGAAPNIKTYTTRLPICTKTAFDALDDGEAVTVNGVSWNISGKEGELKR